MLQLPASHLSHVRQPAHPASRVAAPRRAPTRAAPARAAFVPPPLPRRGERHDGLTPAQRHLMVGAILAAHVAGVWGLLQIREVREAVAEAAPMFVSLIAPPEPPKPVPPPPPPPPMPQPMPKRPPPVGRSPRAPSPGAGAVRRAGAAARAVAAAAASPPPAGARAPRRRRPRRRRPRRRSSRPRPCSTSRSAGPEYPRAVEPRTARPAG